MGKFHFYKSEYIEFVIVKDKILEFSEHCHSSNYIITVITNGTAMLKRNESTQTLQKDDCFFLVPYENHTLFSDSPVSMISVCVKKEMLSSYEFEQYRCYIDNSLYLVNECVNLRCADLIKQSAYQLYKGCHYFKRDENDTISESIENIVTQPELEKSIEQLAAENFISKYHFIRKFRKVSGLTPHKFQLQSRIRKSQRLLIDGHSITETAQIVGFYDQSHFDRYFKMIVGISPTEYVASLSNFLQV